MIVGFLYASFGNVRQVLLVMIDVPFALVGGGAALWLRGLHLNLSASLVTSALLTLFVLPALDLISKSASCRTARTSRFL